MLLFVAAVLVGSPPMVFLDETSLRDPEGVRVEAMKPDGSQMLLKADEDTPSLWLMPTAARPDKDGIWIWYQRVNKSADEYSDQRTLCLAILRPGGLSLPALDDTPPAWGGPNNVVLRRSPYPPTWGGFNVFQLADRPKGYTLLYWDQPQHGDAGAMLAHSNDGMHWKKDPRGTVFTEHNDAYSLLDKNGRYLLYQTMLEPWPDKPYADNLDKYRRIQAIRESPDLVTWTGQQVLLRPDGNDDPTAEFYLMKAFPYGQGYAALLMKYYAHPARPKQHSAILAYELLVSDDARSWRRPYRKTDLGFWSYAEPFIHDGMLSFAAHHERNFVLFQYRPDGLTRVIAEGQGRFSTPALAIPECGLALNCDAGGGWIEVRLLGEDGAEIASAPTARIVDREGVAVPLDWKMAATPGKNYRLRIALRNASLYSIRRADAP